MALHDDIQQMRQKLLDAGQIVVPDQLQGVSKVRIAEVLRGIDRNQPDIVDAVFALLDDQQASWFTKAPRGSRFSDGASVAHIACHIGILQRGRGKMDREGRDYWLKPLWEIGAIEKVFLDAKNARFIEGHPIAKSQYSAYRLANSFVSILQAPDESCREMLRAWVAEDAVRERLELQARLAQQSADSVESKHNVLIQSVIEVYVPRFLPGFELLYIDDSDGDRITDEEKAKLKSAGIELKLGDAVPDVLLWNRGQKQLWVVEAVTSDGEVDLHKMQQMNQVASRSGISSVGYTTAYPTWNVAGARQGRHKNIPPDTFIWIAEDPSKQLKVL